MVVDATKGRVKSSFYVEGLAQAAAGADNGWVLLARKPFDQVPLPRGPEGLTLPILDDEGRLTEELELPTGLREAVEASGLSSPGALLARPVAVGRTVWLVPAGVYQLWRPKQGQRAASGVEPPPCLAARGRDLSGEESEQELRRRLQGASAETKRRIEEFLQRGRPPLGFSGLPRVRGGWERLAVVVRGPDGQRRLDVWDMGLEKPLVALPSEAGSCPGTLALHPNGAWIAEGGRLRSLSLPWEPLAEDRCPPAADLPAAEPSTAQKPHVAGPGGP